MTGCLCFCSWDGLLPNDTAFSWPHHAIFSLTSLLLLIPSQMAITQSNWRSVHFSVRPYSRRTFASTLMRMASLHLRTELAHKHIGSPDHHYLGSCPSYRKRVTAAFILVICRNKLLDCIQLPVHPEQCLYGVLAADPTSSLLEEIKSTSDLERLSKVFIPARPVIQQRSNKTEGEVTIKLVFPCPHSCVRDQLHAQLGRAIFCHSLWGSSLPSPQLAEDVKTKADHTEGSLLLPWRGEPTNLWSAEGEVTLFSNPGYNSQRSAASCSSCFSSTVSPLPAAESGGEEDLLHLFPMERESYPDKTMFEITLPA